MSFRHVLIGLNQSQPYFVRTSEDGERQVSWRVWVLIFLLPAGFLGAAALFFSLSLAVVLDYQRTVGEVVKVYSWPGYTPWDGETTDYSPVFRYEFRPGETTEASTGQSSPNWNYAVGSRHAILFDPTMKTDVKQDTFEQLWALPVTLAGIGGVLLIPALIGAAFVRRWQRGGREANA